MSDYRPDQSFLAALTKLDTRQVDVIITPVGFVADWAERHGYRIVRETSPNGLPIFEIRRGDGGLLVAAGHGENVIGQPVLGAAAS